MNQRLLASFAVFASLAACSSAQPRPEPAAPPAPAAAPVESPAAAPVLDDGFRVDYRPQAEGRTLLEVTEPAGSDVIIWDAGTQIAHDKAPVSADAAADKYYRVELRLPSGEMKEKKIAAHSGQIASVRVQVAAAAGPQAMAVPAFRGLIQQVDESPGDQAKLAVLKTALAYNWITTKMAVIVLDHITYRQSKLDIVPLLRDRILDRESSYLLVNHFTYREDKAKVQELLLH